MKPNKINLGSLIILIAFLSLATISKTERLLASENIAIEINQKLGDDIITGYYTLDSSYNYYMYKIQESSTFTENYNSFTIAKPNTKLIELDCVLDSSSNIDQISSKFTSKTCQVFQSESSEIVNVIYDLSEYKKDPTKNLLIRIKGTQGDALNFYFRTQNSYIKSISDTIKITNAFAYLCFSAKTDSLLKLIGANQYYYQASAADAFLIYGVSKGEISLLDINSFAMVTNQSLAYHYLSYDTLAFFIGRPKQSKDSDNELTVFTQITPSDGDKFIYYKTNGIDITNQLLYHSECKKGQKHYIAVNYELIDKDITYYMTVNTLQGADGAYIADSFTAVGDFLGYTYKKVKGLTKTTSNNFHLHVYRLECSTDDKNIIFNMKYNTKEKKTALEVKPGYSDEGFFDFTGSNYIAINYDEVDEMKIEIFLEESEDKKEFFVRFEAKDHIIENGKKIYLNRTNDKDYFIKINSTTPVSAYIMISGSAVSMVSDETSMIFQDSDTGISFTSLSRKYNVNYGGYIPIKNRQGTARRVCYYFHEVAVFQVSSQNCFVVKTEANLLFSKILLKEASDAEYQSYKYNYRIYIMMYEATGGSLTFSPLEYITDLPQSTRISNLGNDYIYGEGTVKKNEPGYFSRILSSQTVTDDSFFDIYLGNDQESSYADVNLNIICVLGFEIAIPYVEDLFVEENNLCKIVNSEEKNPKIVHVFADLSQYKTIKGYVVNLLMKVNTQKQVDVKFMIKGQNNVQTTLNIEAENTFSIPGPEAYTVYDLNMASLSKIASKQLLLYNNETDSIKIYGRNGNNFYFIDRGSAIVLKYQDFYYSYKSFPKFIVLLGKIGCETVDRCVSKFNVNLVKNVYFYHSLPDQFTESYHTSINIPNCEESTKYTVIFNYFKKPKESTMYFSKQIKGGEIQYTRYVQKLDYNVFEKLPVKSMADLQEMETIDQHTSVIQFKCKNDFLANFYYFAKTDYSSGVIVLEEGTEKEYVIPVGKVYKFSYAGIDEIKVENFYGDNPKITFENKEVSMEKNLATLKRKSDSNNEFSIQNPSQEKECIVKITTSISTKSFVKTSISGLSKYKGAFIYEAPKNAASIKFVFTILKRLRLLAEEKKTVRICYNVAQSPIIDRNDIDCFYATPEDNEFTYKVPKYLSKDKFYIALYSDESEPDAFDIKEVVPKLRDDADGLSSGWIVFIIIIVVLVLLGIFIVIFLIISKRKRVSSGDIEGTMGV